MTAKVTTWMSIIPLPTVLATAVPKVNAATKLKNAAQMTAWPGDSTRVDTTVAIEFAASWKPLMKSNDQRDGDEGDDGQEHHGVIRA